MSTEDINSFTRELQDYFQSRAEDFFSDYDDDDQGHEVQTGVLTGYVLVCGWMGDDGGSWITYHRPKGQPIWLSRGFLSEALHDLP